MVLASEARDQIGFHRIFPPGSMTSYPRFGRTVFRVARRGLFFGRHQDVSATLTHAGDQLKARRIRALDSSIRVRDRLLSAREMRIASSVMRSLRHPPWKTSPSIRMAASVEWSGRLQCTHFGTDRR